MLFHPKKRQEKARKAEFRRWLGKTKDIARELTRLPERVVLDGFRRRIRRRPAESPVERPLRRPVEKPVIRPRRKVIQ